MKGKIKEGNKNYLAAYVQCHAWSQSGACIDSSPWKLIATANGEIFHHDWWLVNIFVPRSCICSIYQNWPKKNSYDELQKTKLKIKPCSIFACLYIYVYFCPVNVKYALEQPKYKKEVRLWFCPDFWENMKLLFTSKL